jgi:phage shock protein E
MLLRFSLSSLLLGSSLLFANAVEDDAIAKGFDTYSTLVAKARESVQYMTIAQYEELKSSGVENIVIVDLRDASSYNSEHVDGAINIARGSIEKSIPNNVTSLDDYILLYCNSGAQASMTYTRLTDEMGYTNVYVFGEESEGGFSSLADDNITTVKAETGFDAEYLEARPSRKWSLLGTSSDLDAEAVAKILDKTLRIYVWNSEESRWIKDTDSDFEINANQGFWVYRK